MRGTRRRRDRLARRSSDFAQRAEGLRAAPGRCSAVIGEGDSSGRAAWRQCRTAEKVAAFGHAAELPRGQERIAVLDDRTRRVTTGLTASG
jgi:hypothetical protein